MGTRFAVIVAGLRDAAPSGTRRDPQAWIWVGMVSAVLAAVGSSQPLLPAALAQEAEAAAAPDASETPASPSPAPEPQSPVSPAAAETSAGTPPVEPPAPAEMPASPSGAEAAAAEAPESRSSVRSVDSQPTGEPALETPEAPAAAPAETAEKDALLDEPVVPVTRVHYLAKNRPAWLDSKPIVDGDIIRVAVKAGPHYRMRQCLEDLDEELRDATAEFINEQLGSQRAAQLISLRTEEIKNRLVRETFEEQLETSVGVMNQAHALLVFDGAFVRELNGRWQRIKAFIRLVQIGFGTAIVLLFVSTVFAYFRLDTATKGYYTGRLQIVAAVAILAVAAAGVLMAKWIPWM